ncbi:hydrogen peroxide-inducible genes activator [Sphingobacterium corticibacter]|uniref:DNA-binding transcriptional regulator OxyR n=1 Tax=Sphingobacterium corticibacter TaxID=2171749 RepID=A0A2T8HGJ0_9SPHI|nr:hydrogen peroxide-inducible genes activator [Sphingobacterium corticibacter]PVH24568.1 DNA-binding transcriptional regulator OxyR [Sphingobacterium corticibacter]
MTLVQLEYIIAVDTYRSFVAAAEKCFVTQPTLSMQIQKLEENLGAKIFDRSRQPVVPTEIGERIIRQARIVLTESKKIGDILQEASGQLAGEFRIGVIPTVAPYLLPPVIASFAKKYPKLKVQIWEYTTEKIVQELKNGTLDCGILSTPLQDSAIAELPLYYETFVAYVSAESKLYGKKLLQTNEIADDNLWLLNEGHCMRGQVLNICKYRQSQSADATFDYNTGSVETLKRMVDINGGITILPELTILDYGEDELQHVRYFKSPEPVREISIVMTKNFSKQKAIEALKQEIWRAVPERFRSKRRMDVLGFRH